MCIETTVTECLTLQKLDWKLHENRYEAEAVLPKSNDTASSPHQFSQTERKIKQSFFKNLDTVRLPTAVNQQLFKDFSTTTLITSIVDLAFNV